MGAGASSSAYELQDLSGEQKAELVQSLNSTYNSSKLSAVSDIELFKTIKAELENKLLIKTESSDKEKPPTKLAKQPETPLTRVDSVAGEVNGEADDEEYEATDSEDEHEVVKDQSGKEQKVIKAKTSADIINGMAEEHEQNNSLIADFLDNLKEGNVRMAKSSKFRERRLTYSSKNISEVVDSPVRHRSPTKRATIYASSEIGVSQKKLAPFSAEFMGTYSCHGIEPAYNFNDGNQDDEDEVEIEDTVDKINQDRGCVVHPYQNSNDEALFIVLDGHGEQGDKVSEFVMRQIVVSLEKHEDLKTNPVEALKQTFVRTNMALMVTNIGYMTSGTTCVATYMKGKTMYVANCGDSRCVLAKKPSEGEEKSPSGGALIAKDLSRDHKPDDPEEKARIEEWGGYVKPAPEEGLTARVYLDPEFTMIGLAMARSIGDFAVKAVGVIPEPEVLIFDVDIDHDQFLIMASDGVWEFISSQEAVDIIEEELAKELDCNQACETLINLASERWAEEEGDYRDDITAIVLKLPLPFHNE